MSKSPLSVGRTGFLACVAILGCLAVADIADQTSGDIASQQNFAETEVEAAAEPEPQMALGHVDQSRTESDRHSRRSTSNIEIGDYEPEAEAAGPVDESRMPLPANDVEIVQ